MIAVAPQPSLLETAERIASLLRAQGVEVIVIGAAAMAAHGYVRQTEGLDFGMNLPIGDLGKVADHLRAAGFDVVCREPDGQDPLGGVIDVRDPSG